MAASAHTFVVIADDSKQSAHLGEKVTFQNVLYISCVITQSPIHVVAWRTLTIAVAEGTTN